MTEILLVEDSQADARMVEMVFAEVGFRQGLRVVNDGEDALDYLHRRGRYGNATRPDLILLDLNLPRKSGLEVLRELRGRTEFRRIPVVVLTSSAAPQDINSAYEAGANIYFRKRTELEETERVLRTIAQSWLQLACLPTSNGNGRTGTR